MERSDWNSPKVVYDISVSLGSESIDFPGDIPYHWEWFQSCQSSGPCNTSKIEFSTHAGTHIDTPLHFVQDGNGLDQCSPRDFILPARVIRIKDKEAVRPYELENLDIKPGDALLFKTENSLSGKNTKGKFDSEFVYISAEASEFFVKKKVSLIGIDYITVDKYGDMNFPVHRSLLRNDILILEGMNLKTVPSGKYTLSCLPLKIKGGEASPVRAVLLVW